MATIELGQLVTESLSRISATRQDSADAGLETALEESLGSRIDKATSYVKQKAGSAASTVNKGVKRVTGQTWARNRSAADHDAFAGSAGFGVGNNSLSTKQKAINYWGKHGAKTVGAAGLIAGGALGYRYLKKRRARKAAQG